VGPFRWPFYERRHAAVEAEHDQGVEEPKRRGGNSGRSLILVSQSASTKRRLGLQRPRNYLRASRPLSRRPGHDFEMQLAVVPSNEAVRRNLDILNHQAEPPSAQLSPLPSHARRNLSDRLSGRAASASFASFQARSRHDRFTPSMGCKTIFTTRMSNIDSRTSTSAQRRFKNTVHLDSIIARSQRSKEFCNTIPPMNGHTPQ
jgi:hypothetical protein